MDKNKNRKIWAILEEIDKWPKEMQRAMIWALRHWKLVEWLCKEPKMTSEEIDEMIMQAREKKDCLLFVLVCAAQAFNDSDETKKL